MRESHDITRHQNPSARAEINLTPLIDVMMVLLIIFMVIPTTHQDLDTSVPRPVRDTGVAPPPPAIVLVVSEGPTYSLDQKPVGSLRELGDALAILLPSRGDKTVLVRASGKLPYGQVVEVMDVARGAGAERMGLLGEGPKAAEPPF